MSGSARPADPTPTLDPATEAIRAFARGEIVVVSDGEERENEADLVLAADHADAERVGFIIRHTGGLLCVPMTEGRAVELDLPPMVEDNRDAHGTAFTVSVDHESAGTGISAVDRAATVRALADPAARAASFRRPGHVFPLVARRGGVLKRAGHTEAAVDLAALAHLPEVALISELVDDAGRPLSRSEAEGFAARHGLRYLTIADLQRHRKHGRRLIERGGESVVPTAFGDFRAIAYRSTFDDVEHLALVRGEVSHRGDEDPVLTRVHSECLTGDVIGSRRCDCGEQLRRSLELIAAEGRGVLVYLRGHEGRGIGLSHKLRAYALQDRGLDTVEANLSLGVPVDSREYGVGAQILADLGARRIRLLSNNPAKYTGLAGHGLEIVERVPLQAAPNADNLRYLKTKQARMGHDLGIS